MTKRHINYQKAKYRVFSDKRDFIEQFPVRVVYYCTDLYEVPHFQGVV